MANRRSESETTFVVSAVEHVEQVGGERGKVTIIDRGEKRLHLVALQPRI